MDGELRIEEIFRYIRIMCELTKNRPLRKVSMYKKRGKRELEGETNQRLRNEKKT